jgi:hypothetical protein
VSNGVFDLTGSTTRPRPHCRGSRSEGKHQVCILKKQDGVSTGVTTTTCSPQGRGNRVVTDNPSVRFHGDDEIETRRLRTRPHRVRHLPVWNKTAPAASDRGGGLGRAVSRVPFEAGEARPEAIMSLGPPLPTVSCTPPVWTRGSRVRRRAAAPDCLRLHAVGFAVPRPSPERAVRSYRTVSPLPATEVTSAVCSLWHCP